jgi:hypothetical protein
MVLKNKYTVMLFLFIKLNAYAQWDIFNLDYLQINNNEDVGFSRMRLNLAYPTKLKGKD